MKFLNIIIILSFLILNSCSSNSPKVSENIIENEDIETEMIKVYNEGIEALNLGDANFAAKKFNEVEILFPQSIWAPRASLMSAYSFYYGSYYIDAIDELNRFIEIYPNHERVVYAYYLLGICYYDQITDEKKDLGSIIDAQDNFKYVVENYPDTDFALDSKFKLELIQEILASKEMYLAKYYIEKEKWIPAINRYKNVLVNFQTTIFVEEALHRLVEIHYKIGLIEESKKYAALLGYNYQSSDWYRESYKVFNKDYEKISKRKKVKNKKSTLDKIKLLLKNE